MDDLSIQPDPEQLRRNLAITLGAQPPHEILGGLRQPVAAAPAPNLAIGSPSTHAVKGPRGTLDADKAERSRMLSTGPGEDQIYNKVTGSQFGQHHAILGKILGGLGEGIAKAGDIGLSAVAPALAINIPGTEYHHAAQIHGLNKQIGSEETEQEKEAQTAHTAAETENLKNPPDKFAPLPTEQGYQAFDPRKGTVQPLTDAQGKPLEPFSAAKVKTIDEQAYDSLTQGGKSPVEALDTIYGAKNTKTEDLPHLYLDALQAGDMAKAALIKRAHEETQVKPMQPPGVTMIVPQADGTQKVERLTPGQTVGAGAQTAAGVNSANTATTQQRNVVAQAQLVHNETPQVLAQIDQMKDALGPVAGRWNEFMQGKVGMDNPQMADLRANLLMYSSAVALMHARGRLPENLREEFDHAINAPKQTAENLKAVITRIDKWTADNMQVMGGGAHNTAQPEQLESGATQEYGGKKYRFKGGDRYDQKNWEEVKK